MMNIIRINCRTNFET